MRTLLVVAAAVVPAVLAAQNVEVFKAGKGDRAVLGVSTASGGTRDTIGVLVADVTVGGPADKAGIEEGDRIASIGDVDLRLAAADASEREMHGVMARRLAHALAKHAPGDVVELRVYHDGQFVTRKVTTAKAAEVFVMPAVSVGDMGDIGGLPRVRILDRVKTMRMPPMDIEEPMDIEMRMPPMATDSGAFPMEIYNNGRHRI